MTQWPRLQDREAFWALGMACRAPMGDWMEAAVPLSPVFLDAPGGSRDLALIAWGFSPATARDDVRSKQ